MTLQQAVDQAARALEHLAAPRAEAIALVLQSQSLDRIEWMMRPEQPIPAPKQFESWLARRVAGESLAVIRGNADFLDYSLAVGPGVLVPRPDTETLTQIQLSPGATLDLGCGSGAIARWLADQPHLCVIAIERSLMALSYARRNLPPRVSLIRSDWARCIAQGSVANVISNPPYIDAGEPELEGDGVCREPRSALVAAQQGLSDLQIISQQASRVLKPGGWCWMEHGYQQADAVQDQLRRLGFQAVQSLEDLLGHPRITGGQWHG